ncbi:head completion/stabilization protein [Salinisphaera sp. USBA-960]|nr:head completion/stabilization protein [Salifodinibacter halophilus]NNC25313.1 head completion/stabilization protein [Salifodinibacter halophilus]
MSLVAADNTAGTASPIDNNGFWPSIDPADVRATERLSEAVTGARLVAALTAAIADTNRQLADWQADQVAAGHATIDSVPVAPWQTTGHHTTLYRRAVAAAAHADLLERYREISATQAGDDMGQAKTDAADDYRRAARWAIAEITDRTHSTVELI